MNGAIGHLASHNVGEERGSVSSYILNGITVTTALQLEEVPPTASYDFEVSSEFSRIFTIASQ
jgi:hypothetical protein